MKNVSLGLCAILISAFSLFSSCKKNDDVKLTLSLTNQITQATIYSGDTVFISGAVTSTGKLRSVQFYNVPSTGGVGVEVPGSAIIGCYNKSTYTFSGALTNITASTTIKVKVSDQNGQNTTTTISVTVLQSNILRYSNLQLGGWDSNYTSILDVDAGVAMASSGLTDATKKPLIDVFFEAGKLGNVDLDSTYYNNVSRLSDTGIRFATTTITPTDFKAMKTDAAFNSLVATLKTVPIKLNDVVFFTAKSGKKGLLWVSSLTSPTGDLMLNEVIQK
jgi:hypothetical protein